jgi:diguanylate cyclase (GGDEF)-like protein
VLLIDLDHFKTINDRFGHAVGDDVLRAAAAQIRTALGDDAWVGRIGGEEFAALVPGDAREGNRRAHRVRAAVRRTAAPTAGETLVVATSVGLAPVASPAELETALHTADDALYRAKDAGRDRVAQGLVGG